MKNNNNKNNKKGSSKQKYHHWEFLTFDLKKLLQKCY